MLLVKVLYQVHYKLTFTTLLRKLKVAVLYTTSLEYSKGNTPLLAMSANPGSVDSLHPQPLFYKANFLSSFAVLYILPRIHPLLQTDPDSLISSKLLIEYFVSL